MNDVLGGGGCATQLKYRMSRLVGDRDSASF
jgi:hypothetical protein